MSRKSRKLAEQRWEQKGGRRKYEPTNQRGWWRACLQGRGDRERLGGAKTEKTEKEQTY